VQGDPIQARVPGEEVVGGFVWVEGCFVVSRVVLVGHVGRRRHHRIREVGEPGVGRHLVHVELLPCVLPLAVTLVPSVAAGFDGLDPQMTFDLVAFSAAVVQISVDQVLPWHFASSP
jgi:hypothetical protein